ncbi:MAG: zinc-dependent metalloprotease [Microthrixaceae bacterium]
MTGHEPPWDHGEGEGPDPDGSDPEDLLASLLEQLGPMLSAMSGGAPVLGGSAGWDHARQAAGAIATDGAGEGNVDPIVRLHFEQLVRVAQLQIARHAGPLLAHSVPEVGVRAVNRPEWASNTVDSYRTLFERLSGALATMMRAQLDELREEDLDAPEIEELQSFLPPGFDLGAMLAAASSMFGPTMLMTLAGSVVGQLGRRAFGSFDLPIPRPADELPMVVLTAVDGFGADWSLPADDVRLYQCLHELAHHAVLSQPHVAERLRSLLGAHADAFEADPERLASSLDDIDPEDPEALGSFMQRMNDPEQMLNVIRSDRQRELLPQIATLVACVEGFTEWLLDSIGAPLLSEHARVAEAFRRRRVEITAAGRFVERLFGLELTQDTLDAGVGFISGIAARGGDAAVAKLWSDLESLPTPAELAAPGLWMARVGLDADQVLPELDGSFEVPDFPDLDK